MGLFSWLGRVGSTAGGAAGLGLLGSGLGLAGTIGATLIGMHHDRKMWDLQNAYNSPENQMARLKQAGLNPNLVYGNANVVGNNSGQRPMTSIPNLSGFNPDIVGKIAETQKTALMLQQEKLAEQNQKLLDEKVQTEVQRQLNLNVGSQLGSQKFTQNAELFPYQSSIKQQEAKDIMPLITKKYGLQAADLFWKVYQMNPAALEYVQQNTDLLESRTGLNQQVYDSTEKIGGFNQGATSSFISALMRLLVSGFRGK